MLAVGSEKVEWINLAEAGGVQVAANGLFVGQNDDYLFVCGGWGAIFQFFVGPISAGRSRVGQNLPIDEKHVMLSPRSLSTHCFH
jgi:hypothetical protein